MRNKKLEITAQFGNRRHGPAYESYASEKREYPETQVSSRQDVVFRRLNLLGGPGAHGHEPQEIDGNYRHHHNVHLQDYHHRSAQNNRTRATKSGTTSAIKAVSKGNPNNNEPPRECVA